MPLIDIEDALPETIRLEADAGRPDRLKMSIDRMQREETNQEYPKKHVIACFRMTVKNDAKTKHVELTVVELRTKLISSEGPDAVQGHQEMPEAEEEVSPSTCQSAGSYAGNDI